MAVSGPVLISGYLVECCDIFTHSPVVGENMGKVIHFIVALLVQR
jgi:hypothetical protein